MINFYNQVPSIYNSASRDFQYLSWLINVVLNSVKHNVDDIYDLPNTKADPRLTELLAMTLGFKVKRNYNQKQLEALINVIPSILKYKGSKKAIELACLALIKASGAQGITEITETNNCVEIQLPETLVDTILLRDLLPYILPAGMTVRIVTRTDMKTGTDDIEVGYYDIPYATWKETDVVWNAADNNSEGPATMFNDQALMDNKPIFSNFIGSDTNSFNAGVLDNSVIPALLNPLTDRKTELLKEELEKVPGVIPQINAQNEEE